MAQAVTALPIWRNWRNKSNRNNRGSHCGSSFAEHELLLDSVT
jgi:hypothetical protein